MCGTNNCAAGSSSLDCCTVSCCNGGSVTVNATGEMAEKCPHCLGEYEFSPYLWKKHSNSNLLDASEMPVYTNGQRYKDKDTNGLDLLIYLLRENGDGYWGFWTKSVGFMSAVTKVNCPADVTTWKYADGYSRIHPSDPSYVSTFSNPGSVAPMTVTCT